MRRHKPLLRGPFAAGSFQSSPTRRAVWEEPIVDVKKGISTGLKRRALLSSPSSHGRHSSGL